MGEAGVVKFKSMKLEDGARTAGYMVRGHDPKACGIHVTLRHHSGKLHFRF
jgi:hypothetical protein